MADLATTAQNGSLPEPRTDWTDVQLMAAELLGQGLSRHAVAKKLDGHLLSKRQKAMPVRRQRMYQLRRLRHWQRNKLFRDLVWEFTVEALDNQSAAMANGVARRGATGRVDAAKFGLELAGRYTPKGHDQPTAVQIVVSGVPRPQAVEAAEIVDGEVIDEA